MLQNRQIARPALGSVAFAGWFVVATVAYAQTASHLVSPSYAPPVVRPVEGGISFDGATGLDAPRGAEKLSVTPSGLIAEGGRPELSAETAKVEASLKGIRVTGADLFAAARQLEEAYARAGYLLVRVSLPPQTVKNGKPLHLVVTDGQVEAIDVSALPENVLSRIQDVLAPLVGKTGLTKAELERRLLLAGDTPGVMLKSTLKAGSKSGGTVIVVDGRYDAVTATLTMDNSLANSLGRYTVGLGADFNSLLGLGEVGYLRLNGYPGFNDSVVVEDPRNRQIIAGFTLPLGTDGFWFNMEGVDSRTNPKSDLPYRIEGHYQRLSTKLGYSWIRARDVNTSSVFSFDVIQEQQKLNLAGAATPFTQDQLRVLRLTQTGDMIADWGGQLSASLTASFGLDALGARNATSDLPLSRVGAEPDFRKLEISALYGQSFLDDRMHLSVAGKAQTSFGDALVSSEQFGLGGYGWLSAFDSGEMQGDTGATARAELSFPMTLSSGLGLGGGAGDTFGGAFAPYLFGAAGIAKLERPTAAEDEISRAGSLGVGIRFGLSEKASPHSATLTLEYAHGKATGIDREDRFNMRFTSGF